jgi:hypothetical protein
VSGPVIAMNPTDVNRTQYLLRLADNALILSRSICSARHDCCISM